MTNYKGETREFYFPYGQIYRFDTFYVVALWFTPIGGGPPRLYFRRLETYLFDAEGFDNGLGCEFWANGDEISTYGKTSKMMPLSALKDTGRAVRKSILD